MIQVKKEWYKGLDATFVDRYAQFSMFDRHKSREFDPDGSGFNELSAEEAQSIGKPSNKVKIDDLSTIQLNEQLSSSSSHTDNTRRKLHYVVEKDHHGRRLLAEEEEASSLSSNSTSEEDASENTEATEDPEAIAYAAGLEILNSAEEDHHEEIPQDGFVGSSKDLFGDGGGEGALPDLSSGYEFDDYREAIRDAHGGYRSFDDGLHYAYGAASMVNEENMVAIDPHVLSTPSLIDIDNDGHLELVIAVSYYFDAADYPNPEIDVIDRSMYVAGGLACWDIENEEWVWMVHLDLTTDKTSYKAYIHSAPTIVDLDGDNRFEILIGTSLGLLYLLDGDTGFIRNHFPMQFHAIEAQIVVADILGSSILEIIVADMAGNLVALTPDGDILWDTQLAGALPYTPTIGDVDGDGQLDIVVVAVTDIHDPTAGNNSTAPMDSHSYVYAVNGKTGQILEGYPYSLPRGERATGPAILVDLHDHRQEYHHTYGKRRSSNPQKSIIRYSDADLPAWMIDEHSLANHLGHQPVLYPSTNHESSSNNRTTDSSLTRANRGLHMLVPAFHGHLYLVKKSPSISTIQGVTSPVRCAQRLDLGDHIASIPLVSDLDNNGNLDIVIGSLNGQVYTYETQIAAHPLNTWNSFPKYRHSSVVTHGSLGISVPSLERNNLRYSDIKASNTHQVIISFDIWDTRPVVNEGTRKYHVVITKGSNKRTAIGQGEYSKPGRYSLHIDVSPPEAMTLVIGMTTEHGLYYEDTVWISVGTRFYVWMKYLPLLPTILLCIPLLLMRKHK
jgi:hypothetical protein